MGHFSERYIDALFDWHVRDYGTIGFEHDFNQRHEKWAIELETNEKLMLEVLLTGFTDSEKYLAKYSPIQITKGLEYIFNEGSYLGDCLVNRDLDLNKRVQIIEALAPIMLRAFEPHARSPNFIYPEQPVNGKEYNILHHVCYMFWDTACIPYGCEKEIITACIEVMGKCARSQNTAVVEGALHGLGHTIGMGQDDLVRHHIERANVGGTQYDVINNHLRDYAQHAMTGKIL